MNLWKTEAMWEEKRKGIVVGSIVRVDTLSEEPWIGRVTHVHTEQIQYVGGTDFRPNGILRVEVTDPLASRKKVGEFWDVGTIVCYPQAED